MKKRAAFDMDEVIHGRYSEITKELMFTLKKDGWQIFIISPNPIKDLNMEIEKHGLKDCVDKICNRGDKGACCLEENVSIFFDDNPDYLSQVVNLSKGTMPLQVLK